MSLATYKKKRDFKKTPEPKGKVKKSSRARKFVIQKHDATQLHYDLRLEIDGVHKSWAVPKGPSLNPEEKRLAVETEDHPLEYGNFEGVIPEGEYGGGTVMIWDFGSLKNAKPESLEEQYDRGLIEFELSGKKIAGGFALIRTKLGGNKKNWLLIKRDDKNASKKKNPVSTKIKSAKTGRTMKEIEEEG